MTIIDLAALLWRRWYVVIACALACLVVVANLFAVRPLYATRASVLFVEPDADTNSALFLGQSTELSPFAAAVERTINRGRPAFRLNSRDATLAGIGVREGVSLTVPNYGSQWTTSLVVPELMIEVVSTSPEQVLSRYRTMARWTQNTAERLQDELDISQGQRIQAVPRTLDPQINYVGSTRQGSVRAIAATLLLGAGLTVAVAHLWDVIARERVLRRRRNPSSPPPRAGERATTGAAEDDAVPVEV